MNKLNDSISSRPDLMIFFISYKAYFVHLNPIFNLSQHFFLIYRWLQAPYTIKKSYKNWQCPYIIFTIFFSAKKRLFVWFDFTQNSRWLCYVQIFFTRVQKNYYGITFITALKKYPVVLGASSSSSDQSTQSRLRRSYWAQVPKNIFA